ncbi:MAG: protease family protein [Thermoproteota archaeon]|nr:protease family protein [Thermoproteota archaeon]
MIPPNYDLVYRMGLSTTFLLLSVVMYRKETFKKYWRIFLSFFIASFALSLQTTSAFLNWQTTSITSVVLSMVLSTVLVITPIIVLSMISGDNWAALFLQKGNIRLGLVAGIAGFFIFAAASVPEATYLFQGQNLSLEKAIAWAPWLLITIMANGIREELLYRGLFLKKYEPLLGLGYSNLLQAIIFSLSHAVAGRGQIAYTPYTFALIIFTFLLGLAWGALMQKTNSTLGSILFHAGTDIAVFLGIFSNLP